MKLKRTYRFLLLIFLVSGNCFSQVKNKKSKTDNFDHYAYMLPIESYESLLRKGLDEVAIYKKLGNANYLSANYDVATFWYEKLLEAERVAVPPDYLYRYAQALKSIKKYDESNEWMDKFKNAKATDFRANLYANNTDYLNEIRIPSEQFTIENLSNLNSKESDFAPSYFLESIVFTTARDLESLVKYNDLPYLKLYKTSMTTDKTYGQLSIFSENLNTKANESSTTFTQDGQTVYFTRNNFDKKSFKRDKNGVSRLKIYRAEFQNGNWGEAEDLNFNSTDYSVAHPSLNSTNTKLYFSSDMPGGKGASDIYVVDILADGSFGIPQNLGEPINTEGRETFPFIGNSGTLYFASDGHPGLGGLDLYKVDLENEKKILNLGSPINSSEDDFSIIMNASEESGYFASNRKGGQGSDDIYRLERNDIDCFAFIEGEAVDKDSDDGLSDTRVEAYDNDGKKLGEILTASDGSFTLRIPCQEKQYRLAAIKNGYEEGSMFMLTSSDKKSIQGIRVELEESRKVADIGLDLVKILELTPIYFDLNSSYLRKDAYAELDKVIDYMSKRPDVKIAVGSHTDSRETDAYNLWLSERRAARTVAYIVSNGISKDRISGKGYGETRLINKCANGVRCSKSEHQLNRRSEFIVIEK